MMFACISSSGRAKADITPVLLLSTGTAHPAQNKSAIWDNYHWPMFHPGQTSVLSPPSCERWSGQLFEGVTKMIPVPGWIIQEREKSVLFLPANQMTRPVWLPRSQITIVMREFDDVLTIPEWLTENNGIRVLPRAPRRSVG